LPGHFQSLDFLVNHPLGRLAMEIRLQLCFAAVVALHERFRLGLCELNSLVKMLEAHKLPAPDDFASIWLRASMHRE
jgi:hypothetical protein